MQRRQWTDEQKKRQSERIREWQPWKKAGVKTPEGKAKSRMNALKHGAYGAEMKEMREALVLSRRLLKLARAEIRRKRLLIKQCRAQKKLKITKRIISPHAKSRERIIKRQLYRASALNSSPLRGEVGWGAQLIMLCRSAPSLALPLKGRELQALANARNSNPLNSLNTAPRKTLKTKERIIRACLESRSGEAKTAFFENRNASVRFGTCVAEAQKTLFAVSRSRDYEQALSPHPICGAGPPVQKRAA